MTKTLKISSIILAFIAAIGMLLLFSGCKKAISQKEAFLAMASAADNYNNTRVDYDNFKDSTFNYSVKIDSEAKQELTYKENPTDTNTVTKTFTQSTTKTTDVTIVLQNVTNTENNEQVKDVHMSFVLVIKEKSKHYYVDDEDETLKSETTDTKTTQEYVLGTKVSNGAIEYFVTLSERVEREGENDDVTQEYYKYDSRDDYVERFEQYLEQINSIVKESFFALHDLIDEDMAILALISATKDGNVVELSISGSKPEISDYLATSMVSTTESKVSFKGDNINKSSQTLVLENKTGYMITKADIGFQDSATNVTVPGTDHYTESATEIIVQFEN